MQDVARHVKLAGTPLQSNMSYMARLDSVPQLWFPALAKFCHREISAEEQKSMFVARFSRAEHLDTLVDWIQASSNIFLYSLLVFQRMRRLRTKALEQNLKPQTLIRLHGGLQELARTPQKEFQLSYYNQETLVLTRYPSALW